MKKIISVMLLLSSITSLAAKIDMIEIKSDSAGDEPANIALQVAADSTIEGVLYQNKPSNPFKLFPINELNKTKESLVVKGPVAIVQLSSQSITKNSIFINIHFIHEFKILGSDRRVKQLKMYYVAPSNLFETMDVDTKKVVRNAFFYINIKDGKEKGIDRVETY